MVLVRNTIYAGGGTETIDGGDGDDVIVGSDDSVAGGDGNDLIFGGLGNDTISGGSGDETIDGGDGNDLIIGGGLDTLVGADGNDMIFGGFGNDTIFGGGGNESIDAGDGDDSVVGSSGDGDDTIDAGLGDDTLTGGDGNDLIYGGPGEDTFRVNLGGGTLFGNTNLQPSVEADALLAEVETDAILIDGQLTLGTSAPTQFNDIPLIRLSANDSNNLIDATGYSGDTLLLGGKGNDTILGGRGRDTLISGGGDDDLDGGPEDDHYIFNAGDTGLKTIRELPGGGEDTLDFSLLSTPLTIDLATSDVQTVTPGLDFALVNPQTIENVYGTAFNDRIYGNAADNTLYGLGGTDELVGNEGNDELQAGFRRTIILDFESQTDGDDHVYASDDPNLPGEDGEQYAIAQRIRNDFASFDVAIHTQAEIDANPSLLRGPAIRVVFNAGIATSGRAIVGGRSERLGWRELAASGVVSVNVNDFLGDTGNRLPGTSQNFVALSSTIASHELAHLIGLRHHDAFGPIGTGIYEKIVDFSLPRYPGPRGADQTDLHLLASPASVGSSLIDALGDPYFGDREAIKLAFMETGQTVVESALPIVPRTVAGQTVDTRSLGQINRLAVPATVPDVSPVVAAAVNVVGFIDRPGTVSESDYYSFDGSAGDLVTVELLSQSLIHRIANIVDSAIRIYGPDGQLVEYHAALGGATNALGAFNDNGFEGIDALLLDVPLPETGTYTVEVDTFSFDLAEAPIYLPDFYDENNAPILCGPGSQAVYCTDADTGSYELFLYQVKDAADGDTADR